MNILVVAATKLEILPFLDTNKNTDVLITGIGIPATVFQLTKKLLEKKYDIILQAGIAGSFNHSGNLGEVFIVKRDAFGDLGIYQDGIFRTPADAGFGNENDFPFENGWLVNKNIDSMNFRLPAADSLTINMITDDNKRINVLQKRFNAGIETMEGAAFHYVCLQQQQDFLQLRSISNYVGESDRKKWKMKEAIQNLNEELLKIIQQFT